MPRVSKDGREFRFCIHPSRRRFAAPQDEVGVFLSRERLALDIAHLIRDRLPNDKAYPNFYAKCRCYLCYLSALRRMEV
jgi:hypothetical protein